MLNELFSPMKLVQDRNSPEDSRLNKRKSSPSSPIKIAEDSDPTPKYDLYQQLQLLKFGRITPANKIPTIQNLPML